MKLLWTSVRGAFVLGALTVVVAPTTVLADDRPRIEGAFTVTYLRPSALDYCASGGLPIEAQGIGSVSKLGPMFLAVKKCLTVPGGVGTYTGRFRMPPAMET